MNNAVKSAALGAAFGAAVWVSTGIWQFFAVTMCGVLCTWLFTPPADPQPRRPVREFVRTKPLQSCPDMEPTGGSCTAACYEFDNHLWAGDGCKGRPYIAPRYPGNQEDTCEKACDGSVRCPCISD